MLNGLQAKTLPQGQTLVRVRHLDVPYPNGAPQVVLVALLPLLRTHHTYSLPGRPVDPRPLCVYPLGVHVRCASSNHL